MIEPMDTPRRPSGSWNKSPQERLAASSSRARHRPTPRRSERPHQHASSPTPPDAQSNTVRIGGLEVSVRILFTAIIIILLIALVLPTIFQWVRQEHERNAVLAELEEARSRQSELERQIELWNNADYVAAQARERLGYVMPGETQYSVVDPGPGYQDAAQVAAAQPKGPARPWFHNFALLTAMADSTEEHPNTRGILIGPIADSAQSTQADAPSSQPAPANTTDDGSDFEGGQTAEVTGTTDDPAAVDGESSTEGGSE